MKYLNKINKALLGVGLVLLLTLISTHVAYALCTEVKGTSEENPTTDFTEATAEFEGCPDYAEGAYVIVTCLNNFSDLRHEVVLTPETPKVEDVSNGSTLNAKLIASSLKVKVDVSGPHCDPLTIFVGSIYYEELQRIQFVTEGP